MHGIDFSKSRKHSSIKKTTQNSNRHKHQLQSTIDKGFIYHTLGKQVTIKMHTSNSDLKYAAQVTLPTYSPTANIIIYKAIHSSGRLSLPQDRFSGWRLRIKVLPSNFCHTQQLNEQTQTQGVQIIHTKTLIRV